MGTYIGGPQILLGKKECARYESVISTNPDIADKLAEEVRSLGTEQVAEGTLESYKRIKSDFDDFCSSNDVGIEYLVLLLADQGKIKGDECAHALAVSMTEQDREKKGKGSRNTDLGSAYRRNRKSLKYFEKTGVLDKSKSAKYMGIIEQNPETMDNIVRDLNKIGVTKKEEVELMYDFHSRYQGFLDENKADVEDLIHALMRAERMNPLFGRMALRQEKVFKKQESRIRWCGKTAGSWLNTKNFDSDFKKADDEAYEERWYHWMGQAEYYKEDLEKAKGILRGRFGKPASSRPGRQEYAGNAFPAGEAAKAGEAISRIAFDEGLGGYSGGSSAPQNSAAEIAAGIIPPPSKESTAPVLEAVERPLPKRHQPENHLGNSDKNLSSSSNVIKVDFAGKRRLD